MYLVLCRSLDDMRIGNNWHTEVLDAVAAQKTLENKRLETRVFKLDALPEIKSFDIQTSEIMA